MKLIILGRGFSGPTSKNIIWAREFEVQTENQIVIGNAETFNPELIDHPVLIIPEMSEFAPLKNILYTTNFYESDVTVINRLAHLARIFGASIHCVHIDTSESYTSMTNVLADDFSKLAADLEVSFINVCSNSVFEGLKSFIKNNRIDLIAMVRHRHKKPVESERDLVKVMAQESDIPILLFPEKINQN